MAAVADPLVERATCGVGAKSAAAGNLCERRPRWVSVFPGVTVSNMASSGTGTFCKGNFKNI